MNYFYKKRRLCIIGIMSVVYNSFSILFAFFLMNVTDSIIDTNIRDFFKYVIYSMVCVLIQIILYLFQTKYINNYVAYCMKNLKEDLLKGICRFSYQYFSKSPMEAYQSFFLNDLQLFEKQYYRQIIDTISSASLLIIAIVGVCFIKPIFLVIIIFILTVSALIPFIFKKKILEANQTYTDNVEIYFTSLSEILQGFSIIKNYNVSKPFVENISLKIRLAEYSYADFQTKIMRVNAFMAFIGQILVLISFAVGGYLAVIGKITTGSIVALSQLLTYTIEPISVIIGTITSINAVDNIKENCEQILKYTEKSQSNKLLCIPKKISMKNVNFTYDKINKIINNATITFESPYKYAIVGKNGMGKSTILQLIAGMIGEYSGDILIDDVNIKDISEKEYNSYIAYLSQSAFVFSMSLEENIKMFRKTYSQEQIRSLINKFALNKVPESKISIETISGGEKAKITAIRTLTKQAPIILMDEPTAAMDERSKEVFDEIISNTEGKLIIVITHRLDESLKKYDRYVIIQNTQMYMTSDFNEAISLVTKE